MPELPEVETVVRTLEKLIKDRQIVEIDILYPKIVENDIKVFETSVINQHFRTFGRRGKFLLFGLDKGYLVVHLRMEGKFFVVSPDEYQLNHHVHLILRLDNGKSLLYHDVRKFGRIQFVENLKDHSGLNRLGPEVWELEFKEFKEKCSKRSIPIKSLLLDQTVISGIGNIYANEILFEAKVNPLTPSYLLSDDKLRKILKYTAIILEQAILDGGTSIRSYTSSLGVTGLFQQRLKVHDKQGEPCVRCGREIKKIMVNGRGTYYCSFCQRKSKSSVIK